MTIFWSWSARKGKVTENKKKLKDLEDLTVFINSDFTKIEQK